MRDVTEQLTSLWEIESESTISGRRKVKLILHEIHPDESVYQHNGISWNEEYVRNNMQSVIGMSIVAEFITEDRDIPYGHGMTDIVDNMPLYEDATMVGHFDDVYIDDVEINGEKKRVLIGEGTLDEMRYPKFIEWIKNTMEESTVKGSVEIVGKPENDKHIIYSDGWKEKGRVPQIYDYSGYAILSVKPADDTAIVLELNNKKETEEEGIEMDEKIHEAIKTVMTDALAEVNSRWDEYYAKVQAKEAEITQLKADIAQKEADIAQLRADFDNAQAKLATAEAGLAEANSKNVELEKEKAVNELNEKLNIFTDNEKEIAKEEIEAFKEDPNSVEINTIVGKISAEVLRLARENVETESDSDIDIFSIIEEDSREDEEDINVI